ncbi:MAG: DUF5018 domain-containing protein, partial [Bacteroidales bacterium]|nr:DUF5018 domain-containing protein [Bacteroidales bacterium]
MIKNNTSKLLLGFVLFLFLCVSFQSYSQPIIVDHRHVSLYDQIPQQYIDSVKKRWVSYAGESHSEAIRVGTAALEDSNATFAVNITESGVPEGATDQHLRVSRATWGDYGTTTGWIYEYGEEDWFTNTTGIQRTKDGITYCNENGFQLDYFGFGWCWDAAIENDPGGTVDPVYHVKWAGRSYNGPQGNKIWGLDAGDSALTGNSVCMDAYIEATRAYVNYCKENNYPTKVFFTTGPIDGASSIGEAGYQSHLKWEYLRNYLDTTKFMLFDYADILAYNDSDELRETWWDDRNGERQYFPFIHRDNLQSGNIGHIGINGAVRLAKAMWVMLAVAEGWDMGSSPSTAKDITGFSFTEQTGKATINAINHTVQIEVTAGKDLSSLTPSISVSDKASINPLTGVTRDFSSAVTYTVTAEDLSTQEWTVTVSVAPVLSSAKEITAFSLAEQTGNATIDPSKYTVDIEVAAGTNVSSLTPTISVSDKASVDPASGASRDFSGVVTYTVTAEDLSTQEWTVTVSVAPVLSSAKEITAFSLA